MTNADKIRAMSDGELAKLINACDNYNCNDCPYNHGRIVSFHCIRNSAQINPDESIDNSETLEWLKQEVEDV